MLLSTILRDTRIALNMNHSCQALIDEHDLDTLTLDELIISLVEPTAKEVLTQAPLLDLGEGAPFDGPIAWDGIPGRGPGAVVLPPDFLRLLTFRMSGWGRAATIVSADSPRAGWQHSPFPGIHGNPRRPVAFIEPSSFGKRLHFFASYDGPNAHIVEARYIPMPRLRDLPSPHSVERDLPFPSRLYHSLIHTLVEKTNADTTIHEFNVHRLKD